MAVALDMQSADFDERFALLVAAKRETSADVDLTVADIIDDVRHRGMQIDELLPTHLM